MVFSSYTFLFFFLAPALGVYYLLPRILPRESGGRARTLWLILASYLFYGWARFDYVALILFSTVVDFICARRIEASDRPKQRRLFLIASIATNLGLLGFFKYFNFGIDVVNAASSSVGGGTLSSPWPDIILPVGISFYTFQSMSYTIDVYRGVVKPSPTFSRFACYVALFPQLVAGPIVRYRDLAKQLEERSHTLDKAARGVFLFMVGFAKKTLIANNVGVLADALFDAPGEPGLFDAWIGVLAYTFQIYFDFSGYSDMAIGLGLMIGFVFPTNFESPYKSESITEFWRRWHISLSTWLRDYLYVPLGGNRKGPWKTYRNLTLTMLLGGLWHGASWTYVLWGAWHGTLLAIERMSGKDAPWRRWPRPLRVAFTFWLVMIGWIMFRAKTAERLGQVMSGFLGVNGLGDLTIRSPYALKLPLTALLIAAAIAFFGKTTMAMSANITRPKALVAIVLFVLGVAQMLLQGFNPFLYYQF